jgi:hypothetical protein
MEITIPMTTRMFGGRSNSGRVDVSNALLVVNRTVMVEDVKLTLVCLRITGLVEFTSEMDSKTVAAGRSLNKQDQ